MKIALFDSIGSFTKELVRHWLEAGHEVSVCQEYNPLHLVGKDLAFFEWADQNILAASQTRLPIPVICRLHSYEAFTDWPLHTRWDNVDTLICVGQHVADLLCTKFLPSCPVRVIPNGIDLSKWEFKERFYVQKPKVALVGEIGHKKGIQLFLEVAQQWKGADFTIAGPVTEDRYYILLETATKKAGMEGRIHYAGRVPNDSMDVFYNQFDYLLSCSPWESQGMSICEAMAKGIKPLIYNFPGAESMYPPELLWLRPKEVPEIAAQKYDSPAYRQWLIDKGWTMEKFFASMDAILANPKEKTQADVKRFYDHWLPVVESKHHTEGPRMKAVYNHIGQWISPEDRVVDLACGNGLTTAKIAQVARRVVGVDLSTTLIDAAKENHKGDNLSFLVADITEWQPLEGEFNAACLFGSLNHILAELRPKLIEGLAAYDKILITIPEGEIPAERMREIVHEPVNWKTDLADNLSGHKVSYSITYELGQWGRYRFIVFEKRKAEAEPVKEGALAGAV